jgi:MYND finger
MTMNVGTKDGTSTEITETSLIDHNQRSENKTNVRRSEGRRSVETAITCATAATTITKKAGPIINTPVQTIRWIKIIELCYSLPDDTPVKVIKTDVTSTPTTTSQSTSSLTAAICFSCKKEEHPSDVVYKVCGQCKVAKYCCRECQVFDWKKQHKHACMSYQRMILVTTNDSNRINTTENDTISNYDRSCNIKHWKLRNDEVQYNVRNELFHKIRFYICPYAIIRYMELGRGLLFIQSKYTLDNISYSIPINCYGHHIGIRNCTVHYITIGEYDQEVCRNDFEMVTIQQELHLAVKEQYDPMKQVVVLMRFRCGHVALGIAPLVPDYALCQRLGRDYNYSNNVLQLNLDE